ncbi:PD-(D/E)XK nuclease-like domain-containing protein [Providencia rettgeri]|uniref:PD-(D/E)XK nuclease-like domain-containing protein n=1 Tax=Providencia rettgeri TaxID=587 RepID=UPI001B399991|nr:PD-(D/E)XK nuclease-like domain-containing protein [Providencia rettgeri]ELR5089787.1 PD-(D/E)XK nuclease-like domain-containing protein [Providencia rettgeri]MBQ0605474.1 PD-(D/E)XK nuclease-like domain-containing protein [Providencia rettgeri]MCJ2222015.1 PD-(D/E)XK nuclease-like domain-containing protein [Providencia rettgeri]MDI7242384.1 PD-(D/E)XK nuclease-like domain-containing protein [Providencia rettgeri]MDY0819476.1 PD-(D/E)XK nuclease-like domain-containing protein [Providencia r
MSNQEQEQFEQRKLSNIVSAILMANDINTPENIDKLTNHLNKAATSKEFEPFEKVAFELSITTTSTPKLMFLHDNDIINAYIHVIKNPDKFRSNIDRKKYFQSLVSPDKEEVVETAKPDVITHASEDKQTGNAEPEVMQECPVNEPPYFEPGRYPDIPNDVYHSSNGISSSMLKDARISLMYYNLRHVSKIILRENKRCFDLGSAFHTLTMEPEKFGSEFSVRPAIPEGAFTNTESMTKWIDEYNAGLPQPRSTDELKAIIEAHNATLPAPLPLSGSVEEIGGLYADLPDEFRKIPESDKHTAAAMKACIKEFNATLPEPLKTSGSRDFLLNKVYAINPDLWGEETSKPEPLKKSGKKEEIAASIKAIKPDAIFEDDLISAWRSDETKIQVETIDFQTAKDMRDAVMNHPEASALINHPNRVSEVSYYGVDDDTGLETRVRPDIEIQLNDNHRIGFDLKSVSLGRFKQEAITSMIRREILNRDYHISAGMYSDIAQLDQFYWIFVNSDPHYHWVAIVEASPELLELGRLEYKKTLRDINNSMNTGVWPAPVTETLTINLTDFETRKLEELQLEEA